MSEETELLNLRQKISVWDHEIKSGHAGGVRKELFALKNAGIPRSVVCELADLARRVQLPFLIIRWLKPFVRPDRELLESTTDERALYAAGLMRIGAHNEAQFILDSITEIGNGRALLFQSHLDILQWNYAHSITVLKKYLKTVSPDSYAFAVGKLNLAAAFVAELDWLRAGPALKELLKTCQEKNYPLLLSNGWELSAQMAILRGEYALARELLTQALSQLKSIGGKDDLYIKKWNAIVGLLQYQEDIAEFRNFTAELKSWETLRDLDFYTALSERRPELYLQVLFGTRFSAYRRQMKKIYQPQFSIPESLAWSFGQPVGAETPWIDLQTGQTSKAGLDLSREKLLFKALKALAKDFYRPFRVGELMQEIYPDEYFDPISSPQRVFQTLRRLRIWLKSHGFPLKISLIKGQFKLEATGSVVLRVYRRQKELRRLEPSVAEFIDSWPGRTFVSQDLQHNQSLSPRTAQRLLRQAVQEGLLESVKCGRKVIFRIPGFRRVA